MMNALNPKRLLVAAMLLAVVLVAIPAAEAQLTPSKVSGTVTLKDGTPLPKVVLRFEPAAGSARAGRNVKVNKKGKFNVPFFPSGSYVISIKSEEYWLREINFVAKGQGQIMNELNSGADPKTGALPAVRLIAGASCIIELVAGPASERKAVAQQQATVEAAGPLKTMADMFDRGDMDGVITEAKTVLAKHPELGPAYYLQAVALQRRKKDAEAEASIRKALELVPDQPGIHGVAGSIFLSRAKLSAEMGRDAKAKEQFAEAAEHFRKELETSPTEVAVHTNLVVALQGAGKEDDVAAALEKLIEVDPNNVQAYFQAASFHRKAGNMDKALEMLAKAPAAGDDAVKAIYNIAVGMYNEKDYATCHLALDKVLEADPNFAAGHNLRGFVLLGEGKFPEAAAALKKYLELDPDSEKAKQAKKILEQIDK